jgi:hypothetical protein
MSDAGLPDNAIASNGILGLDLPASINDPLAYAVTAGFDHPA